MKITKIISIPIVAFCVIIFSVESFGISDQKLQAGMGLRITSVIIYVLILLLILGLRKYFRKEIKSSLFDPKLMPLTSLQEKENKERVIVVNEEIFG